MLYEVITGIAGLMGAGRTELAMSLFGRSYGRNITGEVLLHGKPVDISSVKAAVRNGLVITSYSIHYTKLYESRRKKTSIYGLRVPSWRAFFVRHAVSRQPDYATKSRFQSAAADCSEETSIHRLRICG